MNNYNISLLPGDGTGPEVINETVKILEKTETKYDVKFNFTNNDLGGDRFIKSNELVTSKDLDDLGSSDAILLGAIGHPDVKPGILEQGILLNLRKEFDQYINLRPVVLYPGVETPLANKSPEDINFTVVRENTEGLYAGAGGYIHYGTESEVATQESINTWKAINRCIVYAFEYAKQNDRKKQEDAMMAEIEARRKRNEEMYSGYYNNPFEGYMAGAARGGFMIYARGGFAAGGQKPEGIASLDEGKEMAGLTDSDKSELQMLQMLRIITPSNDPKYKQIEDQIQKLMDKMNLDKTAMSPPHPDAEYKQLMDNFILENPGMQFDSLEDFKEYYMENADFLPSDNAARGGYKKLSYGGMTGNTVEGVTEMDMTAGGATNGPGTGTSDSIPAMLSDGEFVVTAKAVENLGGGNRMLGAKRMYQMMNSLDPNSQTPAEMMTAGRV